MGASVGGKLNKITYREKGKVILEKPLILLLSEIIMMTYMYLDNVTVVINHFRETFIVIISLLLTYNLHLYGEHLNI